MAVKFYSDLLGKFYESAEEAKKAEEAEVKRVKAEKEKEKVAKEERAKRAKEIDEAEKALTAARKRYDELVRAFVRDYRSYHKTISSTESADFLMVGLILVSYLMRSLVNLRGILLYPSLFLERRLNEE